MLLPEVTTHEHKTWAQMGVPQNKTKINHRLYFIIFSIYKENHIKIIL